jgi:DNA primase
MTLSPAFLDELRARTQLSALIGRSVKLTKAGREFKACCPFHNEKTPSFYVNDDKGFYHCFGCSAHGDAIRFLTDARGLPFMDAVKELAEAAGMEVPAADPRAQAKAERANSLYDVMTAAQRWFEEQLGGIEGAEARAYLEKRGIRPDTRARFGFGFAPDSRGKLKTALKEFGNDKLVEAGLLIQPEERDREPYDRFRGRLTFPIRDRRGRVIAFSARILGAGEPKYLNSPETPLFDKGRTLFNIDRAAAASREARRVIVVEGQMDVIALDQAGIAEAVAPLGTAATEHQLELLWRLSDIPTIMFDGDSAGHKASVRAAEKALPLLKPNQSLSFARPLPGEDPDDLLRREGLAGVERLLLHRQGLMEFLYQAKLPPFDTTTPEGRAGLRDALDQLAQSCTNWLVQDEYRKGFKSRFYEDFGWKKGQQDRVKGHILATSPDQRRDLAPLFVRSALYGLSRFPSAAASNTEDVVNMYVDDAELSKWREDIVEAVLIRPSNDSDAVDQILQVDKVSVQQSFNLRFDLRFPFLRRALDRAEAIARLVGMVEFLARDQGLTQELTAIERRIANDNELKQYDDLQSRRAFLWEEQRRLREFGFDLGRTEEEDFG